MKSKPRSPSASGRKRIGLALSGGNALGAYAAGAYEALHEAGTRPDIISGASIGAVAGAIIAGNPPDRVVAQLRAFWQQAASGSALGLAPATGRRRDIYNKMHAMQTLMAGRPGLFDPRPSGFMSMLPGTPPDIGLFDSRPLVPTLKRLIDFDYLNAAHLALVISAVISKPASRSISTTAGRPSPPSTCWRARRSFPAFRWSRSTVAVSAIPACSATCRSIRC